MVYHLTIVSLGIYSRNDVRLRESSIRFSLKRKQAEKVDWKQSKTHSTKKYPHLLVSHSIKLGRMRKCKAINMKCAFHTFDISLVAMWRNHTQHNIRCTRTFPWGHRHDSDLLFTYYNIFHHMLFILCTMVSPVTFHVRWTQRTLIDNTICFYVCLSTSLGRKCLLILFIPWACRCNNIVFYFFLLFVIYSPFNDCTIFSKHMWQYPISTSVRWQ